MPHKDLKTLSLALTLAVSGALAVGAHATQAATDTEQVTVSAVVANVLTLDVSANAVDLGTLSPASVAQGAHTLTVTTNSQTGYSLAAQGTVLSTGGTTPQTIPYTADAAVTAGTSEYGVAYSGADADTTGDQNLSISKQVASNASPVDGSQTTATYKASVNNTQAPGNYSSTVDYTATATF